MKATPTMSPEEVAAWLADPLMGFAMLGPRPLKHGTRYAYSKRGCRCGPCGFAAAEYVRQYRERRAKE